MAYEPTQWRSGDTITSERLNKMEQGIAGSGDVYVLHTTVNDTDETVTYSSVELREDGLPICLIVDNASGQNTTFASVGTLSQYDSDFFYYATGIKINRSTGEVSLWQ